VIITHTATFGAISTSTWPGAIAHNLDIGVAIFFVISGFLLYRPFCAAELLGARRPTGSAYARRRLLRIVPAYWLALTVLALCTTLPGVFSSDWWRYYGFLQVYDPRTLYGGISAAWTLCIEVTFYAALPFYAAAIRRGARGRDRRYRIRLDAAVLIALAVGSVVLRTVDVYSGESVLRATILENFDWFAVGMGLALASAALQDVQRLPGPLAVAESNPTLCWALAIGGYVLLCGAVGTPVAITHAGLQDVPLPGMVKHVSSGMIAALLIAPAVFAGRRRGVPGHVLGFRGLAWLGLISYGIYLYQGPLLDKLVTGDVTSWLPGNRFIQLTLATAVVAILAAALSYYLVERPLLRFKDGRLPRRPASQAAPWHAQPGPEPRANEPRVGASR
jgi:peptidoglycan/LPS O-acetylase OafA/YrhL